MDTHDVGILFVFKPTLAFDTNPKFLNFARLAYNANFISTQKAKVDADDDDGDEDDDDDDDDDEVSFSCRMKVTSSR